jgi:hypothetical protein
MKRIRSYVSLIFCLVVLMAVEGCEKEELSFAGEDSSDVSDEAIMDAYYQDMDDMATVVVNSPTSAQYNGGRTAASFPIDDNRFCNGVIVTLEILVGSSVDYPMGKIIVDFGTSGCTDSKGNVRKGKLIFTYSGLRWTEGTSVVVTTDNYFINGIKLEGTRTSTITNVISNTEIEYSVVLVNGKAIFEDQTFALRESDLSLRYKKGATAVDDKLFVGVNSVASGVTRKQRTYEASLSQPLEYHRFCPLAVSGIKNILVDGQKEIKIEYGNGDCDKTVTVTILNLTKTITVGG